MRRRPGQRSQEGHQLVSTLDAIRGEEGADIVYATQSWMAEHARAAGFSRIIVDVDDLLSDMSRQRVSSSGWHR